MGAVKSQLHLCESTNGSWHELTDDEGFGCQLRESIWGDEVKT
jgi:hypothetical protein